MIVTFHIAVYFVYYVWDTYISRHITGNESTSNNDRPNGVPQSNNNNHSNPVSGVGLGINKNTGGKSKDGDSSPRPSNPDQENTDTSGDMNTNSQPQDSTSSQVEDGEGDCHPCLPPIFSGEEDRGRELIYNVEPECECICTEKKIQFFPPVYVQRYMEIHKILKEPSWANTVKKVIDFGCAELNFESKYLKRLSGIEEIVAVDIDLELLEKNCCKVCPFPVDYLQKRPTPLTVRVFRGSVAHTHDSLVGADAVIAIELIEHLLPLELEDLPYTIFGFIKPKIAVFTTPNADFNVLFKGMDGFRHPDHKFEWSQQQFEDWGKNLVQRYPDYQVTFKGIGPGPKGTEKYGCCSQMATFIKVGDSHSAPDEDIHVQDGLYVLIRESIFPFFKDERTDEEKIRDAAECFITNCKMRSRVCDVEQCEIPVNSVMSRIEYHNKEKLLEILKARSWEIKMNSSGEEVVVFPDSEEEEDSEPECNEYITDSFENLDLGNGKDLTAPEENWDCADGVDMDMTLTDQACSWSETALDQGCVSDQSYHISDYVDAKAEIVDSTNVETLTSSDKLNFSPSEKCSMSETTVPEVELSDRLSSSQIDSFPEKDSNLNFEKSIYETPYNNGVCISTKSDCDSCGCSLPLSDHTIKSCKRSLRLESPNGFGQYEDPQSEDQFCCLSTVSSSCDTSLYATPCCSQRHRSNIPKCLSLQQISTHCVSPAFSTELEKTLEEGKLVRAKKDIFSKSMEGFKSLESDLTCSSTSKIIDSGYPDSYSEYNMDMDLTPEQFDDIETESEENDGSSRSLSPPPPPPQVPRLIDDVRNGDVANNNRDGEGNNLVADMEEEPLEFEARIDENNEVLNLAAANDAINFDHNMKLSEPFQEVCGDCIPCVSDPSLGSDKSNDHPGVSEKSPSHDLFKLKSVFTEKNTETLSGDSFDKQSLRSTKSDTSIVSNYSTSLDSPEKEIKNKSNGSSCHQKKNRTSLKTYSSLTTVLDGRSKFSNCSLVGPVEVYQVTGIKNSSPRESSKVTPSGSREPVPGTSHDSATSSLAVLADDRQSLVSVYQSAESLNNLRGLQAEEHLENSFPDWLLRILITESTDNEVNSVDSVQSVWDSDSMEERMENFDVQVDARGGGDPQRDTWH